MLSPVVVGSLRYVGQLWATKSLKGRDKDGGSSLGQSAIAAALSPSAESDRSLRADDFH
jgi:hypothetical protein